MALSHATLSINNGQVIQTVAIYEHSLYYKHCYEIEWPLFTVVAGLTSYDDSNNNIKIKTNNNSGSDDNNINSYLYYYKYGINNINNTILYHQFFTQSVVELDSDGLRSQRSRVSDGLRSQRSRVNDGLRSQRSRVNDGLRSQRSLVQIRNSILTSRTETRYLSGVVGMMEIHALYR